VTDDDDERPSVDLSGDRLEILFGLGVTTAALVAVAILADVWLALVLLAIIAIGYLAAVLIVAATTRSLRRGVTAVTKWSFGFFGRWFPL
jgi:hypothetical protein